MDDDLPDEAAEGADSGVFRRADLLVALSDRGYELGPKLGEGGMGEVFTARRTDTGEELALKLLVTTAPAGLAQFAREFEVIAAARHPNLIALHELVVLEGGAAFFTMERVDGRPFVDWVRDETPVGELPDLDRLERGLRQLFAGVELLHARGCIHRDLKPANVLVTPVGRVVLLDFGLVTQLAEPSQGTTVEGKTLGTPSFLAPEVVLSGRVGPEADDYALGVMIFECLTGRLPHRGLPWHLLDQQDGYAIPDPTLLVSDTPQWLREICMGLLEREPSARLDAARVVERLRRREA